MVRPLSLLIVEDSDDDVELLVRELRNSGYAPEYTVVCTPEALRAALDQVAWDVVVSDWSMPRFNGLEAFRIVREHGLDVPFMIVSGTIGEDVAVEALKAGVQDFMTKGKYARLGPAVERELRDYHERQRRRSAEAEVERRRQEIAESEQLLRLVIENVPDAIAVIDREGEFVLWNRPAEMLVAPEADAPAAGEERYGFFLPDRATPHATAKEMLADALLGAEIVGQEVFVRHPRVPDGVYLTVNTRVLRDAGGAVRGALGVFHDLTAQKAASEQLMISDRMASIGMLAAGVAHEINNPLAAVMANLELVQGLLTDAVPDVVEMLDDARTAADRVRLIVRDLKIFSRHEELRSGAVDIHGVLESSIRMAWNEIRHRAQLVRRFGPGGLVQGTESRLGQVFLNLIVNAAQSIPEGHVDAHAITLTTRVDGQRMVVDVTDTGSGIAPQTLRQLFSPFFTTKPIGVGTGLGLAICRRIITGYGGEIQVDSELGRGSTFRVILPLAQAGDREVAAPAPAAPVAAPPRRGTVLVIDDEPLVGPAIRRVLGREHDVTLAPDALEALRRIGAGERYDVILCDLMMPHMTGMEFHAELCRQAPEQAERTVFLTGGAFTPAARAFLDEVPNTRMEKPFDRAELRALVNQRVRDATATG